VRLPRRRPGRRGLHRGAAGAELVGHITNIRTWFGWLYLATLIG
jgi:hypothetical protein